MARISKIANPEFAKSVAEAYINGCNRDEMAEMFGVHKDTITDWTRDPRIQAHAATFARDRVNRITRKTDAELERRMEYVDDEDRMPTELLLKIRKELLGQMLKVDLNNGADQPETINEAMRKIEDDPELARQLQEWAAGKKKK